MTDIQHFAAFLEEFAPTHLAEEWDNVGLLLGDRTAPLSRVMTCLTITPEVVDEAVEGEVDLVVSHHPLPFKALRQITTDSVAGGLVLRLIQHRISVYSPHTAFDSAAEGINQRLADRLSLERVVPLVAGEEPHLGAGRTGEWVGRGIRQDAFERLKESFGLAQLRHVGPSENPLKRVGVACGSGGSFLRAAADARCDLLVTGEATFHTCLEAESLGIGLVLLGHFTSERFACEELADHLAQSFPDLEIWASRRESDPVKTG